MNVDHLYRLRFGEWPRNGVLTQGAVFLAAILLAVTTLAAPNAPSPSGGKRPAEDLSDQADPRRIVITNVGSPRPIAESVIADNARKVLPGQFREYQTKRYLIFSDADSQWTIAQGENLERAHHQFHRVMQMLAMPTAPLRHNLVCILFASRENYQKFAVEHDKVADPWIAGYYAPHRDWIVFYHPESNPSVVEARAALAQMADHSRALEQRVAEAERAGRAAEAQTYSGAAALQKSHLQRELARVDEFAHQVSIATTLHEATHQLLFHTGVQTARVQYPLWICEGLATTFETDTPRQAFGPDFDFGPRREKFAELLYSDCLLPLERLVGMTTMPPNDTAAVLVVYHQSYALVTWMVRDRRGELTSFLKAMQSETQGRAERQRLAELFEQHFGPIDEVEAEWLAYERRINRRPAVQFDAAAKTEQ